MHLKLKVRGLLKQGKRSADGWGSWLPFRGGPEDLRVCDVNEEQRPQQFNCHRWKCSDWHGHRPKPLLHLGSSEPALQDERARSGPCRQTLSYQGPRMGPDSELAGEGQRGSLQLLPVPGYTDPRVTGVPLCGALGFEALEPTGLLSDVSLTVPLLSLQTCLTSSLC